MLEKEFFAVACQIAAGSAGRLALGEQGERPASHRCLHQGRLAEPCPADHLEQPVGLVLDPAPAAGLRGIGLEPLAGKSDGLGRSGGDRQDRAGLTGHQPHALDVNASRTAG
ncbi:MULTISPECIES: hypothetical protein [unclassified Streptomyces]|uniref:hypothetical protein n=1 Tax=unclassified Streptomyces TaxID=2593676 RepID=UPI002251A24D|nr:hypothetical protein [Streptomyces sp. NBC_00401]MCX5081551.1 hypothetical protein [Streptomyces sp. NBC_00401]